MPFFSPSVETLITELNKMPGIGRKSAQRLAFYLLKIPKDEALALAKAITSVKEKVSFCTICFNITEEDPCHICRDGTRDPTVLCVVEKPSDVIAVEKTSGFKGRFHVLGGALSPLDGIGPDELKVKELLARLDGQVKEIILATNPNAEGEATALFLSRLIKPSGVKVSRIARGLPMGSDLDLADEMTLTRAIEGRIEIP
ncbi:MAG: recombination protein RecR [Gemmatimonadota bacterium]|nr:MAG: recombination protein RecR [Gemmatimonadota bacterium]